MKILHTGDWHIRDKDIDEGRKCLEFIVETANTEKPGLIVIAGDISHNRDIKMDSDSARLIFDKVRDLADVAPVAVVAGTPSHDGQAHEVLGHVRARHDIYVPMYPGQVIMHNGAFFPAGERAPSYHNFYFNQGSPCVVLSFVPTPTKQFFSHGNIEHSDLGLAGAMTPMFAGFGAGAVDYDCPHVLIGHFTVGGATLSSGQQMIGRDVEISRDQIALANADAVLLAHIHYSQKIEPNIFYCGSIYRENRGETEAKGFYVHVVGKDEAFGLQLQSRFVETPARKFYNERADMTRPWEVSPEIETDDFKDAAVKIDAEVWQDEAGAINIDEIKEYYLNAGAESVEINLIRKPRENVRSEKMLTLSSLRDKVIERAALDGHEVSQGVLDKCDLLESETPDDIVAGESKGGL